MKIVQSIITLPPKPRGFHLVTREIEQQCSELKDFETGLAHLFILHTSASLTINENADPSVRSDMETLSNHLIPENFPGLTHTLEGSDDMPAHMKASLFGAALTLPLQKGRFLLGTWQGIYLNEHRDHGGNRRIAITILGNRRP